MSNAARPVKQQPWLLRSDLRLALVTGLSAGFGLLSPIPFGYYLPMTTAAVLSGSYGSSMKMGIQRLMGSLMGVLLLLIFSRCLDLPLALGLGLALGTTRLLGGALGLEVGYKVGGNIIVMGWLVHNDVESSWGALRLGWTAVGIVVSLWAARWVWPSRAIPALHRQFADLFDTFSSELSLDADVLRQDKPRRLPIEERRSRRTLMLNQLNGLRQQRQAAQVELGGNPENHPLHQLWSQLDLFASQLVSVHDGFRGLPAPVQSPRAVRELHEQEARVLDNQIAMLSQLSEELRRPSLIDRLELPIRALQNAMNTQLGEVHQLRTVLEHATASSEGLVSEQRLRQIVLRASLLGHMAMVTKDAIPGLAGLKPVLEKR